MPFENLVFERVCPLSLSTHLPAVFTHPYNEHTNAALPCIPTPYDVPTTHVLFLARLLKLDIKSLCAPQARYYQRAPNSGICTAPAAVTLTSLWPILPHPSFDTLRSQ